MSGIYIHIPFCKQACNYCDFHFSTSTKNEKELIDCIIKEIKLRKDYLPESVINSIYFGGGTPSYISMKSLERIFTAISEYFSVDSNVEITLEANPDDLTKEKLNDLKTMGVNRLSIGVQSFFDDELQWMNRAHSSHEAHRVIKNVKSAGFENYTIDLIYGSPHSSTNKWLKNLQFLLEYDIPHFSAYSLTVEPKTALAHQIKMGKSPAIKDEETAAYFKLLVNFAETNGYDHYEISNFSKHGFRAIHNYSYWEGKSYLGIGPSAHSYDGIYRQWNISNNNGYIKEIADNKIPATIEKLSKTEQYNELVLIKLRISEGISGKEIEIIDPVFVNHFEKEVLKWINKKYIINSNNHYHLSKDGKFFADQIASDLFYID